MKIGSAEVDKKSKKIATSLFFGSSRTLVDSIHESTLPHGRIYEIRYDLFSFRSEDDLSYLIESLNADAIPFILTCRGKSEEVLRYAEIAVSMGAPAIDLDHALDPPDDMGKTSLISSMHLYGRRPSKEEMKELMDSGADLVKIAVSYDTTMEFLEDAYLISVLRESRDTPLAFVPMGENSGPLRLSSLILVSDLAYAKHREGTAEGQLLYEQYAAALEAIGLV